MFKKLGFGSSDLAPKVAKILPLADEPDKCDPSQCACQWNQSCFRNVQESGPLWESAKPFDFQVLVSTGVTDWPHNAFDGSAILETIDKFDFSKYGKCKKNVSSLPYDIMDPAYKKQQKADILLMPYFVWIHGITKENYKSVLSTVLQKLAIDKSLELPTEIDGASVVADPNRSYIFLCSHKTRDKRCGLTAPVMKKEFDAQLRDRGLYRDIGDTRPGGVTVAYTNHVGGHKFAANVMVFNKGGEFAWFARCTPLNVGPIIKDTVLEGKVFPDIARTVKKFDAVSW